MKKNILNIAIALAIGSFTLVSCGEEKESHNEEAEHSEHAEHMAAYQCPMKCEGDKTYEEAGSCPKCNMDLKEVEHAH